MVRAIWRLCAIYCLKWLLDYHRLGSQHISYALVADSKCAVGRAAFACAKMSAVAPNVAPSAKSWCEDVGELCNHFLFEASFRGSQLELELSRLGCASPPVRGFEIPA